MATQTVRVSGPVRLGAIVHVRSDVVLGAAGGECVPAMVVRRREPLRQDDAGLHDLVDLRAYWTPATWPPQSGLVAPNGALPPGTTPADAWCMMIAGADELADVGRWHFAEACEP